MRFLCPHCNRPFDVEHPATEQHVACPHCQGAMALPASIKPPAPAAGSNPRATSAVDLGFDPRAFTAPARSSAANAPAAAPASSAAREVPAEVDSADAAKSSTPVPRRKLTREESRRRRQIRSTILMVVCLLILLISALVLSRW